MGLEPREDGWRKITQVYLRTEHSKFALACFGLALFSRDDVRQALEEFFHAHPETHWQVEWGIFCARRKKKDGIDIVEAEFGADGALTGITPFFGPSTEAGKAGNKAKEECNQAFIAIYNKTRHLVDKKRPLVLKKELDRLGFAREYFARLLSSAFIHFEDIASHEASVRFSPPDFIRYKHPGCGVFNIICRLHPQAKEADLWFQCHHVCIDGLPMQEALLDFKAKWAKDKEVSFPASSCKKETIPELCSNRSGKGSTYCLYQFVNFHNFVEAAHKTNHEQTEHEKKCITAFRLLLWRLGSHPAFRDKKFLVPVNLPQRAGRERSLGFVLIRPGLFFNRDNPEDAFLEFQEEFNRQVKLTITRRSESYELFEAYALLPPFFYALVSGLIGQAAREFAGSIGVSIIDRAEFFFAPSSDIHSDGFIAIGNFFKPAEDGGVVCPVSIKGPKDKIRDYLSAIEEIAKDA
jgi:hypothetical protein